ncbi:MAG: Uma2 family endonuclease [Dehalococcoidia bacterium]
MVAVATSAPPRPAPPPKRTRRSYTPEEFLRLEDPIRWEMLDDGTLQERNMGMRSDEVSGAAIELLRGFVYPRKLGVVFGGGTGLQIFAGRPLRVPRADAGFISANRLPGGGAFEGHLQAVPDLLVEVVSPRDTVQDVENKVKEYLSAGVRLVWVLKPHAETLDVYRSDGTFARLTAQDTLSGGDVLPGFEVTVARLFAR